jgi:hypothetical protein
MRVRSAHCERTVDRYTYFHWFISSKSNGQHLCCLTGHKVPLCNHVIVRQRAALFVKEKVYWYFNFLFVATLATVSNKCKS